MSFIADRVVMDGLTFDDILLIPATFRATASKFSKVVICIRSFLQILYHSITTKVVAINIQASEAVIQDVFLYHSSITPLSPLEYGFCYVIDNQYAVFYMLWKKHIE